MSFKTTLILALILALIGGYAYFIEHKGAIKKEEKEQQKNVLLELKKEDVS
jgi:sensor domain CHASE-containing protein